MLWRNVLFLGVLAAGGLLLVGSLFPTASPTHWHNADGRVAELREDAGFQQTVAKVDAAFRKHWADMGIEPAPRADDLAIMRRVSLALTGTIPSLEEIRMYERIKDGDGGFPSARKRQGPNNFPAVGWWTAGLLEDPRSSDYLAERFARAYVGVEDGPFLIYRRRRFVSWLASELQQNRPYDHIVRKLIASDGLWTSEPSTNFVTVTITPGMEGQGPDETKLAGRVYRAFLGIRIDCAQCHDHPFAEWAQEDFHGLAAFFGKTTQSFTGIREGEGRYTWEVNNPTAEEVARAKKEAAEEAKENTEKNPDADDEPLVVRLRGESRVPFNDNLLPAEGNPRQRLAAWVTHAKNKPFARATVNRVWALMFGRPLVEPVDDIFPADILGESEGQQLPAALDILAEDFARHGYDLRRLIQLIVATEVFQRECVDETYSDEQLDLALDSWAIFPPSRLRPEQVVGALLQACSIQTIDHESHVIWRLLRTINESGFVERYGDAGDDEFLPHGGTIPQRLLMLNGNLLKNRTEPNPVTNASTQIAMLAPDDKQAVETAYLAIFTRLPTRQEAEVFLRNLKGTSGGKRQRVLEDIYATLLNSTEFSWNH